jgi:hypothetical protein
LRQAAEKSGNRVIVADDDRSPGGPVDHRLAVDHLLQGRAETRLSLNGFVSTHIGNVIDVERRSSGA